MARDYADKTRASLPYGNRTDYQLANELFMADRDDIGLISLQIAAQKRIRWLSAQLALAKAEGRS